MTSYVQPLVSVLTPVYNMALFLPECIESVLKQTYGNYEYIIVNNCSTDRSLEIAQAYAKKDPRIRVHNNDRFVGVIENHNIAFRLISPAAKYCKVVPADDFIFNDCIKQMVELAEANPSVGIVGSYQISGAIVRWQGFKYPKAVFPGREVCRQDFLGGESTFGYGSPTSILYRADLVRKSKDYYPNASPHADTSACIRDLQDSDFGFIYQVLSYERIHGDTQSSHSQQINRYISASLNDLIEYGPLFLSRDEYERLLKKMLNAYYQFLGINLFRSRGKEFWDYHKGRLKERGYQITFLNLVKALVVKILRELMNPEQAFRKIMKRYLPKKVSRTLN